MKAALYCRVSTDEQREKQSIETQIDFARRYADLHDLTITEFYKDDGVSGGIPCAMRPEGARLLADAQAGQFDLLLIYRVDRLSRSLVDLLQTAQILEDTSVTLQSMTEPFDTSTPLGKFVLQLLGMLAELEKSNIRDRSIAGTLRCAREGRWLGGMAPVGYRVEKDRLVVDPDEAALVHRLFTLCVEDGLCLGEIAELMNAEGILPRNTKRGQGPQGKGWHVSTVWKILKNRTYIGEHFYGKRKAIRRNGNTVGWQRSEPADRVMGAVPPIIDPELFAEAERILKQRNTRPGNAKRVYLLSGLIKCGVCGGSYCGVSPARRHVYYYKCVNYMHAQKSWRCPAAIVRGDLLEADVWADIVEFAKNPGKVIEKLEAQVHAQTRELVPVHIEQDVIRQNIARLQAERARVIGLVRKALISDAEAEAELTKLQAEVQALEDRAATLLHRQERTEELRARLAGSETLLQRLSVAVDGATPEKRREIARLLVDVVKVDTVHQDGKKKAKISATYVFEPKESISSIPHGRPEITVTPLSARPEERRVAASRP